MIIKSGDYRSVKDYYKEVGPWYNDYKTRQKVNKNEIKRREKENNRISKARKQTNVRRSDTLRDYLQSKVKDIGLSFIGLQSRKENDRGNKEGREQGESK